MQRARFAPPFDHPLVSTPALRRAGFVILALAIGAGLAARAQADDDLSCVFTEGDESFAHELCPMSDLFSPKRTNLLGEMGGLRPALAEHGMKFDATSTLIYQGVASGGRNQEFVFGGRNDYYLTADASKLGLWEGLIVDLHGETLYGDDVNGSTGAISPVNTAALFPKPGEHVTSITGLKFTQIVNENLMVFAGKLNIVDGYMHPFAAGKGQTQFMNTSFTLPPIFGRTVPYSSLGAGFAILDGKEPIFSMIVIDPVNHPTTSGVDDAFSNGASLFGNLNIPVKLRDLPGHQQMYFSWSSRTVNALDDAAYVITPDGPAVLFPQKSSSWSLMYAFDQYLFVDPENPQRGWGVFGQFALSDGNPNPIRYTATVGIGGSSPLKSRPADTFGVGYYFMETSSDLQRTLAPFVPLTNEQGVELYYNIAVTPWFHITPDLQVVNPTRQAVDTALVLGLRTQITY